MIVDVHTHLWQSPEQLGPQIGAQLRQRIAEPWENLDASPAAHEAAMSHVDVAIVHGFQSRHLEARVPNELIAAYVQRCPRKVIGFAGIDPMAPDAFDELDRVVPSKLSGVTISPAGQNFHPQHTRAMAFYEQCQRLGLPIMVHQGMPFTRDTRLDYAQPYLLDEVARSFPQMRLIIAHCGHPWVDQTLTMIAMHRNVFADLAQVISRPWQLYNLLLNAHQLEVTDRLLFGSDFPFHRTEQAISTLYSLHQFTHGTNLPTVPREKLRGIVERDALAMLGLTRTEAAASTGLGAEPRRAAPAATDRQEGPAV